MKAIVCEMCSSHDVVKQDGFYICQSCGTKYSTEEARKLMVEIQGKVDVTGSTVKVDTAEVISRSLLNARRAMQKEDWEETEKYYNLVEQNDPTNIEAIFYSAYAKAKTTLINDDIFRREAVFNSFGNSVSIIDDNFDINREEELRQMVSQMITDVIKMSSSNFVYTAKKNNYGMTVSSNQNKTYAMFAKIKMQLLESLINIGDKLKAVGNNSAIHYYDDAKALLYCFKPSEQLQVMEWTSFKCNSLLIIAGKMAGIDNEAATLTTKKALSEYENSIKSGSTKTEAEKYKAFCEKAFRLLATLDPTFNVTSEIQRSDSAASASVREKKKRAIIITIAIVLTLLFLLLPIIITVANQR